MQLIASYICKYQSKQKECDCLVRQSHSLSTKENQIGILYNQATWFMAFWVTSKS